MTDRAKKTLLLGLLAANILATGLLWWRGSSPLLEHGAASSVLIALGRLMGLALQLAILVQLILVSRLPLIERPFGFDKLNRAHRILGYVLLGTLVLHPALLTYGYALGSGIPFMEQQLQFVKEWPYVLLAVVGLDLMILAGLLSLPWIRRRLKYGAWHGTHLLMYLAVGLAFRHQFNSEDLSTGWAARYWFALNVAVFGVLIAYRFLKPFRDYARHRFVVERVVPETADVTSVHIGGRAMERFAFEPGQYVHVSFLKKGLREPHPFSLSQAPDGRTLRLSIKNSGDFTSRIRALATTGTKLLLEGPFGRFTARAARTEKFLLIAGGIGITPIRSMLQRLAERGADAVLLYANRSPKDVVFAEELDAMGVRRHDVFSQDAPVGAEKGFVDEEKIRRLVPDFAERDIYVCGPPVMMDKLVAMFRGLGVPKARIHFEKFAY
jgi:predicted ferric reductase